VEPKQKKQKKKLSKRQLKKQKKKDRKAAFPSSNGGAQQQNYVGGNLVTEQTLQVTQARDGKLYILFSSLGWCIYFGVVIYNIMCTSYAHFFYTYNFYYFILQLDDFVPPPPTWEPEKENVNGSEFAVDSGGFPTRTTSNNLSVNPYSGGVDSGGFPNANHSNTNSQEEQLYQDSFGMAGGLYDIKPALSMIVEEKSPRNTVASPRNGSSAGGASPRSAHSGQQVDRNNSFGSGQSPRGNQSPNSNSQQGFGRDESQFAQQPPPLQTHTTGGSAPQAQQIMSPTHLNSGMKPPLTPNRGMGGPSSSGNSRLSTGSNGSGGEQQNNLTPSQYRSPQPPPNNSSRGGHFNNPNNSPGNSMSSGTSNSGLGINGMTIETNNSDTIRQSMSPDDQSELRGMRLATADSADMCLSADSADEEYNRLRSPDPPGVNGSSSNGVSNTTNGVSNNGAVGNNKGKQQQEKFVSALDRSPFSYSGEEDDNALFPALVEDKDPWNSNTSAWPKQMSASQTTNQMETQEDIRAWTPQASSSKKGTSFTFDNSTQPMFSGGPMSSSSPSNKDGEKNLFEMNFADFEPFDPLQQFTSSSNTNSNKAAVMTQSSSSKSVAVNSSPVSALLEDSRARRKSRESSQRSIEGGVGVHSFSARNTRSGGSINSAPALNASQIRSTIRSSKGHHYNNNGSSSSISRVIDNLELHVNKRQSGGLSSTRSTSARSQSSASGHSRSNDGTNAIREAKERIRRENMMNNESKMIDMLAAGGSSAKAASAAAAASNHEKKKDDWLFDEVASTLGPRSVAADLESLGGRSGKSHRSSKSHRSHRSKKSSSRRHGESSSHRRRHRSSRHHDRDHRDDGVSVDSRTSRNSRASYRSYQTTKSMVSQMSEQSRSVANDLLRLEAQLSMVGKSRNGGSVAGGGGGASTTSGSVSGVPKGIGGSGNSSVISKTELNKRRDDCGMTVTSGYSSMSRSRSSRHHSSGRSRNRDHISASARRAAARTLRSKVTVKAPPGKLGIILANRTDSRGTVVSGVRTSSVLAEQVSPGDRIIAIDDEDVSQMNVKEITTIMARKSEFERVLVLLAAPKVQYD